VLTVTDPLTPPPVDVEVVGGEDEGDLTWSHPGTLGLAALVLGGVLLLTTGVLTARGYTAGILPGTGVGDDGGVDNAYKRFAVASTLLSALFFVIPLYLGRKALDQLVPGDGAWTGHVARAAILLSGLGLLLGLVRVLIAVTSDAGSAQVFGF
jgi:hypothetical protein